MSFASRFPKVAALLGANANEDDDQRRDDDEQDEGGDAGSEQGDGDDGAQGEGGGSEQDQGGGGSGDGGSEAEAEASLATLSASDRAALRTAFARDADALVAAERDRCIAAFTSDAGRRSPSATAKLLQKTTMSAKDVNDTLSDVGATTRTGDRARLNRSSESRPDTGAAREPSVARNAVLDERKKARRKRNAVEIEKRGAVRANRTEFDARDVDDA